MTQSEDKAEGHPGDHEPSPEETTFAREGPEPPANSTGGSIAEMNEAARDSVIRNIRPDESVD